MQSSTLNYRHCENTEVKYKNSLTSMKLSRSHMKTWWQLQWLDQKLKHYQMLTGNNTCPKTLQNNTKCQNLTSRNKKNHKYCGHIAPNEIPSKSMKSPRSNMRMWWQLMWVHQTLMHCKCTIPLPWNLLK